MDAKAWIVYSDRFIGIFISYHCLKKTVRNWKGVKVEGFGRYSLAKAVLLDKYTGNERFDITKLRTNYLLFSKDYKELKDSYPKKSYYVAESTREHFTFLTSSAEKLE